MEGRARWIATFVVGLVAYVGVVSLGAIILDEGSPNSARWAIALGSIAAALFWLVGMIRVGRASKELDRLIVSESSSVAFFVTMLGALTYALLESWVDFPKLSMWSVWTVGMFSWATLTIALKRKLT